MVVKRKKRARRSAEDARSLILDAAEKRLEESGPAGIRLQEVARDAGIAHPTILHHFGSREGLVEAVVMRALEAVQRDVAGSFASEIFDAPGAAELLKRVMGTLADRGHARLLAWLALEGHTRTDPNHMLRAMAEVMHARRISEHPEKTIAFDDTLFVLVLGSLTLIAESVVGASTWDSAGLADDKEAPERFHRWFLKLLEDHLHRDSPEPMPVKKAPKPTKTRAKQKG